ncbi:patatin-like phospholipase family protein [Aquisalibacillus elongatus]|uniref:Putative patatin/cPLA2 family phospholipase n=1 Tax=Aquisalibacillus elongatus TaxID=485577 RepID=A0A3N5BU71_9BACI|nr:patatin family protein [Aquisalibacillus elongatus]RPF53328.1 putative patatin/cPLA2 family phospholipase [Aquisalibacillus elongatus]
MSSIGLVLEGGGSRGIYTAGVLRYLMEEQMYLPYTIGVSAGACHGSSYISRQKDRNREVSIDYVDHPEYLSLRNFIKKREMFGMDFLFDRLPNELVPFDYETFDQTEDEFVIGVTDCMTGEPVFYKKSEYADDALTLIRASSSIPLLSPVVEFEGRYLMDGGIADPVPIKQSIKDGNEQNIVILTRNRGYYKKPQSFSWYIRKKYYEYPGLIQALEKRHTHYNETLEYIFEEEKKGNVLVISPSEKLKVGRMEKSKRKLTSLYDLGYQDAQNMKQTLEDFIGVQSNV